MQTTPSWMQHAALLAGLGPRAFGPALEGEAMATDLSFRTCIEAGSGTLVGVEAPGVRRLHLWTRRPSAPGAQRWTHWLNGDEVGEVVIGAPGWQPHAWGWERPLHGLHQRVGALAALYRVDADHNAEPWFSYHLPRQADPGDALRLLGMSTAWSTVAEVWATLLGRPLPPRTRPWSLGLQGQDGASHALRVSSSLWALVPEAWDKCERLAQAVHTLGGGQLLCTGPLQAAVPRPVLQRFTGGRCGTGDRPAPRRLAGQRAFCAAGSQNRKRSRW